MFQADTEKQQRLTETQNGLILKISHQAERWISQQKGETQFLQIMAHVRFLHFYLTAKALESKTKYFRNLRHFKY